MPREKNQKIKIVRISDILRNARGIENAVSTVNFIAMLAEENIPCDRRTLADNISELKKYINDNSEYNYIICETVTPKGKLYYSETKKEHHSYAFSEEDLITVIKGINALSMTEELPEETAVRLKELIVDSAPLDSRKRLTEYAEDENDSILDTVTAKMLIDSINSFSFIDRNTADKIINVVIRLADPQDRAELAKEKPLYRKNTGKGISLYEMDTIRRSIKARKKMTFLYFTPDENLGKKYHNNGEPITVQPLHMVQSDDNYYLVCYSEDTRNNTKTYRIDRMENIRETNEDISEQALTEGQKDKDYAFRVFRMYSGPEISVTLSFDDSLIGHIFDKFGADKQIIRTEDGNCEITQMIQVSPPFWGWLFQFGNSVRIKAPEYLAQEYKLRLSSLLNEL